MARLILMRGGGDLASGAVMRLARAGLRVVVAEVAEPLAVRRTVSFASAVFTGAIRVEEIEARLANTPRQALDLLDQALVPVLVDPDLDSFRALDPLVLIDGRMLKRPPETAKDIASLVVGLGPGFIAGENCHAVVETRRGPVLGRVVWSGPAEADTGLPDPVGEHTADRVLRAPQDGRLVIQAAIGDILEPGSPIAEVAGTAVRAPFKGVLRGIMQPGLRVTRGQKIGDLDPRCDPRLVQFVSDKALAVGGGVLEAVLARPEIRQSLWDGHPRRGADQR